MSLAREIFRNTRQINPHERQANIRLLNEARQLLERVIQMDAPVIRHAWAWRDLAIVLQWLQTPKHDVINAFKRAIELAPHEPQFKKDFRQYHSNNKS